MKKKIRMIQDMPVEVPQLDREGEEKRKELNRLARKDYEQTGRLSSKRLREACDAFEEVANEHLLQDDPGEDEE